MSEATQGFSRASLAVQRLHGASFIVSLLGFTALNAGAEGSAFALGCGLVALLAAAGLLAPGRKSAQLAVFLATSAGAGLVLAVPFGRAILDGASLPTVARETFVWPQVLTLLFASRIVADQSQARITRYWRSPLSQPSGASAQSLFAALLLGLALALAAYRLLPDQASVTGPVLGALTAALHGGTALHVAIVVLFCVFLAGLVDAARVHLHDRAVLRAISVWSRDKAARADFADLLAEEGAVRGRASRVVARGLIGDDGRLAAIDAFDDAARGFLRGLLPVLPLLGFLGTVIGLALAVADLQGAIGPEAGTAGLSRVLSGLAVKFETTLLGLLFSILGGVLLAILEKSETQANAAAAFLARHFGEAPHG